MKSNDEIHRLVNAIALKNASEHSGRTNVNTVISRILSLKPELKKELKKLMEEIRIEVDSVNKLDLEQQKFLDEINSFDSKFDSKSKHDQMDSHPLPLIPNDRISSGYSISSRA